MRPIRTCGTLHVPLNTGSFSPSDLFLQLGAEQHVGEEEDVPQLPRSLHQLHHEAVLQQLAALRRTRP